MRRRLPLLVGAWLVFQAASLAAMLPRDCCAAHRPADAHETPHCERTAPVPHCPMRAADGTPCPMHRVATPDNDCAMSGACGGPFGGLSAVLSQHAVLAARIAVPADLMTTLGAPARSEDLLSLLTPPDPPPPRG